MYIYIWLICKFDLQLVYIYVLCSNVYKNTGRVVFSCTIIVVACVEANTHFAAEIDGVEGMKPLHFIKPKGHFRVFLLGHVQI